MPITQYLETSLRRLEIDTHHTNMFLDTAKKESQDVARVIASLEAQIENPNSELKPTDPLPNFDKGLADGFAWVRLGKCRRDPSSHCR